MKKVGEIEVQAWYVSHAETLAQNVVGQIIAFVIMSLFGIETEKTIQIQATFLVVAYIRGYIIRRIFNRIQQRVIDKQNQSRI